MSGCFDRRPLWREFLVPLAVDLALFVLVVAFLWF